MDELRRKHRRALSYTFLNTYFLLDFQQDTTRPYYMRTMRFRHRVAPKDHDKSLKSIVDPRYCATVSNDYCHTFLPLPKPKWQRLYRVPFSRARSHHYQFCGSCSRSKKEERQDDTMLRFEQPLTTRVQRVLDELGMLHKDAAAVTTSHAVAGTSPAVKPQHASSRFMTSAAHNTTSVRRHR
jgi:hypothetical protein